MKLIMLSVSPKMLQVNMEKFLQAFVMVFVTIGFVDAVTIFFIIRAPFLIF